MLKRINQLLKEIFSNQDHDLTAGSIPKGIVVIAIPMILELVMESLFAIVDIFFVGKLGIESVAVVGLTETVLTLVYAVAIGMGMAATAFVARRVGEGNLDEASVAAKHAIAIGGLTGAFFSVVLSLLAPYLLKVMGANQTVIEIGTDYTRIIFLNTVNIILLFIINGIFRGAGKAFIAMKVLWIANGVNIVLDPLLIFGFGPVPAFGLEGAAMATFIGRAVGVMIQVYFLRSKDSNIDIKGFLFKLQKDISIRFVKVSAGGVGQFLIESASWIFLIRIVAEFGSTALAAYTFSVRVMLFVILPSWGFSNAAATMVGQNLGAKKPVRAAQSVNYATIVNTSFLAVVGIVLVLFRYDVLAIFTEDQMVLTMGARGLLFFGVLLLFFGASLVLPQAFNGAGDTETPTIVNFFCFWLIQLSVAYLLAFHFNFGVDGVYIAIMVADLVHLLIFFVLFKKGKWKNVKV